MQTSALIGARPTAARLRQMIHNERLPHALLLLGPAGSEKLSLALVAARYLLCTDRQTEDACGQCAACRKVDKLAHPDLHFSFPTIGSKMLSDAFLPQWRAALTEHPYFSVNDWLQRIGAENKQGNITRDECLSIIRKLSLKTFESEYKVLIMWLPEYLGGEGNRLLKLIEEPPENTVFLLVAEQQDLILNTILSRCQLLQVPAFSDVEIVQGLQAHNITVATAEGIARLVDGDFNEALQMATGEVDDHADIFLQWFRECYKGHALDLVNRTDALASIGRESQKHFLRYTLHFLREMLLLQTTDVLPPRLRPNELASAQKLQAVVNLTQVEAIVQLLSDGIYHIERNANPKILFLDMSIQVHQILRNTGTRAAERRA